MASKARRILHMTSDAVHASLAAAVLAYTDFKEIPCRFFFSHHVVKCVTLLCNKYTIWT